MESVGGGSSLTHTKLFITCKFSLGDRQCVGKGEGKSRQLGKEGREESVQRDRGEGERLNESEGDLHISYRRRETEN